MRSIALLDITLDEGEEGGKQVKLGYKLTIRGLCGMVFWLEVLGNRVKIRLRFSL